MPACTGGSLTVRSWAPPLGGSGRQGSLGCEHVIPTPGSQRESPSQAETTTGERSRASRLGGDRTGPGDTDRVNGSLAETYRLRLVRCEARLTMMREAHGTKYAQAGQAQIAYRVAGEGPNLLCQLGTIGLLGWEMDWSRAFFDRLATFSRTCLFDPRGCGRSDPILPGQPRAVEDRVTDSLAVMDDVGMEDAFLFGMYDGGAVAIVLAATHPERVRGLFLVNTWARLLWAEDYPFGISQEVSDWLIQAHRDLFGTGFLVDIFLPSMAHDPEMRARWADYEQRIASRAQAVLMTIQAQELDVRQVLKAVRVPTVVAHTTENRSVAVEHGRYIAEHIPGARFLGFPGIDHVLLNEEPLLEAIEEFVAGTRRVPRPNRILATVLFTDIVNSTAHAAAIGDRRWREILDRHDHAADQVISRFGGRLVKTTGDGVLATFDAPTKGVQAASELIHQGWAVGLEIRAGLHTGEVEQRDGDLGGLAVHIASRIAEAAGPGEVLVSSTVKDLSAGSRVPFVDRGLNVLKGVPDEWRLFTLGD